MKPETIKSVVVFCGSATGADTAIIQDCKDLAKALCVNHITLVYGGGNIGLMGILADEMLRLGGKVIGVIPRKLVDIELAHKGLTTLHIVADMHERKALMAKLADAFLVLPGGIGTMDEFFEIFTWLQLGYHEKPVGLSNIKGFYNGLIGFLDKLCNEGFVSKHIIGKLMICDNATDLLNKILK
jgi:uncharacterized protein (TIGR00730 family)